jgi:SAM-dependent methyltransferase
MGNSQKYDKVVEVLEHFISNKARILEVSCGRGEILARLKEKGFIVKGTNYSVYEDVINHLDIDNGIDILEGLPYQDGSFDGLILVDVMQNIHDHEKAIQEVARVLSEGGIFLILSPNIMKISSRVHFLTTGFFKVKKAFIGFDVPAEYSFAFHNHPPHVPVLLYQLRSHSFEVIAIDAFRYKWKSLFLWMIFFPFICLGTYLNINFKEKNLRNTKRSKSLFKALTSYPLLCGESWILVVKKEKMKDESKMMTSVLPSWSRRYTFKEDKADL